MRASLASALFGGSCYLCHGAAHAVLCTECEADLPRLAAPLCPRCALPSAHGAVCGRCLAEPPRYDATVAALAYAFPADVLVQSLKFHGELALAPVLARFLRERIPPAVHVDRVLPMPLSRERLKARGYNQAVEIARHLGPQRLLLSACERRRDTEPQLELPFQARRGNVRGAFACTQDVKGLSIAVVDDVMTTGTTLDEMAKTLKGAGAARVVNWVVARTLLE